MLRNIALKTIRDRRRMLLWWTIGIFAYSLMIAVFWPVIEDQQEQLASFLENYPSEMFAFLGIESAEEMFTPAGYISSQSFGLLVPLAFAILAAAIGAQLIAGEEEANTLDLLMSNPVSRTRVVVEKWMGLALAMLLLGVGLFVASVVTDIAFGVGVSAANYFAACVQGTLLGLVFGSAAFAVGALGGQRGLTIGIAAAIAAGTFLINSLRGVADWIETAAYISPFYYYDSNRPLFEGIDWVNVLVLAVLALIGLATAVWAFPRRDIGT